MNAKAWFYSQSFHSSAPLPSGALSNHNGQPELSETQASQAEALLFPIMAPHSLVFVERKSVGQELWLPKAACNGSRFGKCDHGSDIAECVWCDRGVRTIQPRCACHSPLCRLDHDEMACAICLQSLCESDAVQTAKGDAHEECAERAYSSCYDPGDTVYPR